MAVPKASASAGEKSGAFSASNIFATSPRMYWQAGKLCEAAIDAPGELTPLWGVQPFPRPSTAQLPASNDKNLFFIADKEVLRIPLAD